MKIRSLLMVILLSACFQLPVQTQTLDELREQLKRDQAQYNATNALIGKKDTEIQATRRNRGLVENNIATHRNIIGNLERQTAIISDEVTSAIRQIRELNGQLDTLKADYGRMVYSSWKIHLMNDAVAFLFASRDFNDATRRLSLMKRYNKMREAKGAEIDSTNRVLNGEIEKLGLKKQELDESRAKQADEMGRLENEKKQLATIISGLEGDRQKLRKQAQQHKDRINSAQKQIDKIIARQTAAKDGRSQAQKEHDIVLSGKFEDDKGKLPWPVSGGSVLHKFGLQKLSADVTNDYKGLEIAAPPGAAVRSVSEGEVVSANEIPYLGKCVIVRSGNYIVIYANLAGLGVKTGDKVSANQQIGSLSNSADTDEHTLTFQIWQGKTPVNPALWLRPQ